MDSTPNYLFVPGLRDHVAEHWQTILQSELIAQGLRDCGLVHLLSREDSKPLNRKPSAAATSRC